MSTGGLRMVENHSSESESRWLDDWSVLRSIQGENHKEPSPAQKLGEDEMIGHLVSALPDEICVSIAAAWGTDTTGFRYFCVDDTLRVVMGQVDNRIFIDFPVCRDKYLLDTGVAYAQAISVSARVLALFPRPLRRLVAPLVTRPNRRHEKAWFRVVRPEIERRLKEYEDHERHPDNQRTQPPNDFLQWSIEQAKEIGDLHLWDHKTLAARLLLVNAASVYTSAFAITHIMLDFVGPGKPEYIEELREGICSVVAEYDAQWDKSALAQVHKLDSIFHESQRLNSVLTIGPLRIVSAKNGVTTPSGVFIPKGYQVGIPAFENHIDTTI